MLLISQRIIQEIPKRFKAPRHLMYLIDSVIFVITSANANRIVISDRLVDDQATTVNELDGFVMFNPVNTNVNNVQYTNLNVKTKFLTIGMHTTIGATVFVYIFGEYFKASRTDLLIEWFRKGRL